MKLSCFYLHHAVMAENNAFHEASDVNVALNSKILTHIQSFPDSILLEILSKLNFIDLCRCSRVCHRWYSLAHDFTLRKRIVIEIYLSPNQFSSLVQNHFTHHLEEFRLIKGSSPQTLMPIEKNALWKICNQCSHLKRIVFSSCSFPCVSLQALPPSLELLSIRGSEIYPDVFFGHNPSLSVPHLTCLDMGGVSNFLTSQDLHVLSTLKSLKRLYIDGCFRVNNGGIESITEILPQLEVFDIEGTDVSNEGAMVIFNNCCNIRELYIGHTSIDDKLCTGITSANMPFLLKLCIINTLISCSGRQLIYNNVRHSPNLVITTSTKCSCLNKQCYLFDKQWTTYRPFEFFKIKCQPCRCQHYLES